jgi:hypothetical protein
MHFYIYFMACFLIFGKGQRAYPADIDSVKPAVSIRSPFEEPVIVAWGGNNKKDNYHVWLPFERWAYDLFALPACLESQRLEDYGVYGMDVVAPISGTIVGAYDKEKDHGTGDEEAEKAESTSGNYVFIKIEETGTYLVLGHLKYDSVCVKEGDYVTEGTLISKAGNTGSSTEPHLHIHHQRQDPNKRFLLAEGLPLFFRDTNGPVMPKGDRTNSPLALVAACMPSIVGTFFFLDKTVSRTGFSKKVYSFRLIGLNVFITLFHLVFTVIILWVYNPDTFTQKLKDEA